MTDLTPRQHRVRLLEEKRMEATRLLAAVRHETVQNQVRLASRDLAEAEAWLRQENVDSRPAILKIVDLAISLADSRLQLVAHGLETYGPDAMLIG